MRVPHGVSSRNSPIVTPTGATATRPNARSVAIFQGPSGSRIAGAERTARFPIGILRIVTDAAEIGRDSAPPRTSFGAQARAVGRPALGARWPGGGLPLRARLRPSPGSLPLPAGRAAARSDPGQSGAVAHAEQDPSWRSTSKRVAGVRSVHCASRRSPRSCRGARSPRRGRPLWLAPRLPKIASNDSRAIRQDRLRPSGSASVHMSSSTSSRTEEAVEIPVELDEHLEAAWQKFTTTRRIASGSSTTGYTARDPPSRRPASVGCPIVLGAEDGRRRLKLSRKAPVRGSRRSPKRR